jgi:hypothetical protein
MTGIPSYVKKWCTRKTGYAGEDHWFRTLRDARAKAADLLYSGKNRIVRIGKMSEERYHDKKLMHRDQFVNVERWELVNGVPKKVGVR